MSRSPHLGMRKTAGPKKSSPILFFVNSLYWGGTARVLSTLSKEFVSEYGFGVVIVTIHDHDVTYEHPEDVEIITLRTGKYAKGIAKFIALPAHAIEFALLLRRLRPVACMSFLLRANLVNVWSGLLFRRRPIIISERNFVSNPSDTYESKWPSIYRSLQRASYRRADVIVAISHGIKESLVSLGVPSQKVKVIHNPQHIIHPESTSVRKNGPTYRLVSVARLDRVKDFETMLRSLKQMRNQIDVKLDIVGDGPEKDRLERIASELGIRKYVHFHGWLRKPSDVVARCDCFVLTSRFEGFGNAIVEAMMAGLPVVLTDCPGGPREIVGDNEYGILTPVGDANAFGEAVVGVLTDENMRSHYVEKSFERSKAFDVSAVAPQYLEAMALKDERVP